MVSASPYGLIESAPPEWRPQEDRAASAFVGINFFLFLETSFEIFRVFKKRRGLYFWSLSVGVVSTAINNIAIILKYLVPGTEHIWPLYTLMALSSWTCYSLGQLTVLYSRLHLVVDHPRVQRWVLYLIFACAFFFVIPIWIVVWPAWNIDPELTQRWSAPDGIVERFTQLGFTMAETTVSGIYINALLQLLKHKPTVRQRRVFLDLVYVNVITIALDIVSTTLVYLNQTGVSHPVQIFSYILKFRLEFLVLNQLMAVAARGLRRETFGEKRYHNDSIGDASYWDKDIQMSELTGPPEDSRDSLRKSDDGEKQKGETEIAVPAPVLEEVGSRSKSGQRDSEDSFLPLQGKRSDAPDTAKSDDSGSKARAIARSLRPRSYLGGGGGGGGAKSVNARRRRKSTTRTDNDDDDDEIPLHMWERNGEVVMRIPWFDHPGDQV
ncbi:MAG: hypothetical protein Q9225_000348 [Loekoesia sp. 1 TL-2023]